MHPLHWLGWDEQWQSAFDRLAIAGTVPGRVIADGQGTFRVGCEAGELLATVTGRLRREAVRPDDLPVVGDWVAIDARPQEGRATANAVLPRRTALARRAAGREAHRQVLAANVDTVFVVTAVEGELNPRRVERLLALAWESGARPVVLLNKADRVADAPAHSAAVAAIAPGVPVHATSALTGEGLGAIRPYVCAGKTVVLIGASGVGKSSIVNCLLGEERQAVAATRESDDRGRHTTTSRQLIALTAGGLLLDTPGLREVGLAGGAEGLSQVFEDIEALASGCRFRDCRHESEPGCAVRDAVERGSLDPDRLESFHKLCREIERLKRRDDPLARAAEQKNLRSIHRQQRRLYRRERGER